MNISSLETPQQAARRLSSGKIKEGYEPQSLHEYKNQDGQLIYFRIRLKHPNGDKWIRPMYLDANGKYQLGEPPVLKDMKGKLLYGLNLLAQNPNAEVYVVEGERVADKLNAFFNKHNVGDKYITITSGSASSADQANWTAVADRKIVIWPDQDDPGEKYAAQVCEKLTSLNCYVTLLDIDTLKLPPGGDFVDWLENNPSGTLQELLAIPTKNIVLSDQKNQLDDEPKWDVPNPIQVTLHPVPTFEPEALLPQPLRDWVIGEADRMPCPPDFIAASTLVALSSIIGARCAIRPKSKDNWLIIPNLWGGIVSPPSAKKSPAIGAGFKPLNCLIETAAIEYQQTQELFSAEQISFEAQTEAYKIAIKKAAKHDLSQRENTHKILVHQLQQFEQETRSVPTMRRYKTNDATVEKLGELLQENPSGLLVFRDELVGLLSSWDRQGHESDRSFFLEAWDGDKSYSTDRIGRGSIFIPNLCVSVFGGIQPDKLACYLEKATHALANDGLLQRFQILIYPNHTTWEWRDNKPAKDLQEQVNVIFEHLADFIPVEWGALPADNGIRFPYFYFHDDAQQVFIDWTTELHTQRIPNEENFLIQQHLAKYDKLFPSIALILHLVDCASTGLRGPITKTSALRAAAWCDYLEQHARRCYGLLIDSGLHSAQALAEKISQGKIKDNFTAREVSRKNWSYLTKDTSVQTALVLLEDEGWLRSYQTNPKSGRSTIRYLINPQIKKTNIAGDQHD